MAGKIPAGEFNTRVTLNADQPMQSLRELKSEVSAATSAWKSQRAELKLAGDELGAAKAKYEGITSTLSKQKGVLEAQKASLQKLEKAQSQVDRSTKDGQDEYERYAVQIARAQRNIEGATTKVARLSQQQDKAKNSLNYYKSGLASAQNSLQNMSASSGAYVRRLEAEGKTEQANKAKLQALGNEYQQLNKIYSIQSEELSKIASSAGKSSEAYRRQKVRVDETATSLAKTKTQMADVNSEMRKANPSVWDRIKSKLTGVNGEAKHTHSLFHTIFTANFWSGALQTGLTNLWNGLKSAVSSGMELNGAIGKIKAQWAGMGVGTKETNRMVKQMGDLKVQTGATGDQIATVQRRMANWSVIGTNGAEKMSKSIFEIGINSRMSADKISNMSAQLMRVGSTGKVTLSSLNRITRGATGFYSTLAKGAGMSQDKLKELLASGKVTQKQFQEWMAASAKYGDATFKAYGKTQAGAQAQMNAAWDQLKAKMSAPLFDVKTSGMNQLASLMSSKPVQQGTHMLGEGLKEIAKWAMQGLGWMAQHKKDIVGIGSDFLTIAKDLAIDVWKDFVTIIGDIGDAFGLTGKKARESKDPMDKFKGAMDGLAKNKDAIKKIADAMVIIAGLKTIGAVVSPLYKLATLKVGKGTVLSMLSQGFSKMGAATGSKTMLAGSMQSLRSSAGGFSGLSTAGKLWTGAAGIGVAADAAGNIAKAFTDKKAIDKYKDAGKGIGSAVGGAIGMYFGGPGGALIGSQIGKVVFGWGGKAVFNFQKGWTAKKPPKNFWSMENLGWSAHNMFKNMGKGIESGWSNLKKGLAKGSKGFSKTWSSFWKGIQKSAEPGLKKVSKNWQSFWKDINKQLTKNTKSTSKGWSKYWSNSAKQVRSWANRTRKNYTKGIKFLEKSFQSYAKSAKKSWATHWQTLQTNVSDFWTKSKNNTEKGSKNLLVQLKKYHAQSQERWQSHWDGIKNGMQDFYDRLKANHGDFFKTFQQIGSKWLGSIKSDWSDNWESIRNNTANIWDSIRTNSSDFGSKMNSWFSGFGSNWKKGWSNLGAAVSTIWSGAWSTMQSLAKKGINLLIGFLNGGIGAVNSVIHFFGGGKSTFSKVSHLATGTGYSTGQRRPITRPTLAVVNDGNDSPETGNKESWYRPNTGEFGVFQGRSTPTLLAPGTEVFNASETRDLLHGVGFEHFAGGTGFLSDVGKFFGGIDAWIGGTVDKLKKWFDTAENVIKNPGKYLDGIFHTGSWGLDHGAILDIGKAGFSKAKNQVSNFWKTLWQMVSGQLDGGGAEGGLLGAVEKYGKGHPYVWGAAGPDSFDCSGLVMYALKHAFGVNFPHYSGAQFNRTAAVSDPQPGDLVFFGPGGSEHVGVYAGNGNYWSAMSPSAGIGMSKVSSGPGHAYFRRVPGLKGEGASSTGPKASKGLESFVKNTVGSGFWKFIGKLADLFGINADADPGGMGVERWGEVIKRVAAQMHTSVSGNDIAKILDMIRHESGGDPSRTQPGADPDGDGSGPARGLLQFKTRTFNYYKLHRNDSVYNGIDALRALFNDSNWRSDIHWGGGWAPSGRPRFANGGLATTPSIFGEAGPEMAIPLSAVKSSRTYELIGKTAAIAAARDGVQVDNQLNNKLIKKIDTLTEQMQILVAVLSQQTDIQVELTMDKRKMGQALIAPIDSALAKKYSARRMGFSG